MIITDNSPKTPRKNGSLPLPGDELPRQVPPPAYGSQQFPPLVQTYGSTPIYRQSPGRRFFRALAVALLIWFLASMFVRSIVNLSEWTHRHGKSSWNNVSFPKDVDIEECAEWQADIVGAPYENTTSPDWLPYSSRVSYELPVLSETLFLLSQGSHVAGSVQILSSKDVSDFAIVDVVIRYYAEEARDWTKVCLLNRKKGERGVGIVGPYWDHRPETMRVSFEITVVLPASGAKSPLHINNFETNLALFKHELGDLQGNVDFKSISLHSSNMPVNAISLHASAAEIQSSNAPITGFYNTSGHLSLQTSNAPVEVDVVLYNSPKIRKVTGLIIRTSNAPLQSTISLSSNGGGTFDVNTRTSNSHLDVSFPTSPADSVLKFDASTSNSPANVGLHSAYEGTFALATSIFSPLVEQDENAEDPTGKNRIRKVDIRTLKGGYAAGCVYWSDDCKTTKGSVSVRTSIGPVKLSL